MKFGEVLLEMGGISTQQLELALKEQEYNLKTVGYSEPIGNILLRNGLISEAQHEEALVQYFKVLAEAHDQPAYVRETAKIAYQAIEKRTENSLSEETKMLILRKMNEYEEKIGQFERSISTLNKMEKKKVIEETIDKEKKEIEKLLRKIEALKTDLEKFS